MATKLGALLYQPRRGVEQQDLLAAFRRLARERWGERMPLEPLRVSRGTLMIVCPSPLWKTELLFQADMLVEELAHEIPGAPLRRITAFLAG